MYDIHSLKQKLEQLGIHPNKKLGQNFLINSEMCERIVESIKKYSASEIIEVGPGLGALTEQLIEYATENKIQLTLIELDQTFSKYWMEQGKSRNIKVVTADALSLDWSELKLKPNSVLISNLPFQIAASLLIELSIQPCGVAYMVLMFQKEVGQRIAAHLLSE